VGRESREIAARSAHRLEWPFRGLESEAALMDYRSEILILFLILILILFLLVLGPDRLRTNGDEEEAGKTRLQRRRTAKQAVPSH